MYSKKGVTLIELLITLAVLAIITAIAYPSFSGYMMKGKRIEAIQTLYRLQLRQEEWRISHPSYAGSAADLLVATDNAHYDFTIVLSDGGYMLTATALPGSSQQHDREGNTGCSVLALDRNSDKTPPECWR